MKKWIDRVKNLKKEQLMILLLCGVLLLVIAVPTEDSPSPQKSSGVQTESEAQTSGEAAQDVSASRIRQLERQLKSILSKVEGIGKTEVMLTIKSDGKKIVEKDVEQSQGKEENQDENAAAVSDQASSSESTVYQRDAQGNERPYVTEELTPEIEGVLVIAQGAGNASVTAEITEAVMALFGVEAHKIKVMKME